jgi:hypothetical protein
MSRVSIKIIEDSGKAYKVQNEHGHIAWMPHNWVRSDITVKLSTFIKNNEEYEIRNGILLKDTGKKMPIYDSTHKVEIKPSDLDEIIEGDSGVKHSQLAILGAYPLRSGWKRNLIGTFVTFRRLELARLSKGKYLKNERIIPCLYDEARLIQVYEEELQLPT